MTEMARLRSRLEKALRARGYSAWVSSEAAFHMTDWLHDLYVLHDLYTGRTRWTSSRVNEVLMDFLVHVPNHVAAAAKVLAEMPVSDLFEVGAIEGSKAKRTNEHDPWRSRRSGKAARPVRSTS